MVVTLVMLLVMETSLGVSIPGSAACNYFEAAVGDFPLGLADRIEAIDESLSDRLGLTRELCGVIDRFEERGASGTCFKMQVAVAAADYLFRLWPLELTELNGYASQIRGACANLSTSLGQASSAVCEPLFNGNETRIVDYIAGVGSSITPMEYADAIFEAIIPGGGSVDERLSSLVHRIKRFLLGANDIVGSVTAIVRVSCTAVIDLRHPILLCLIAAVVLLAAAIIVRTVLVRYHRFMSFWRRVGAGAIPLDAVVALLFTIAGGSVCVVGLRQAADNADEYNRAFETIYCDSDALEVAVNLLPVITAFVLGCIHVASRLHGPLLWDRHPQNDLAAQRPGRALPRLPPLRGPLQQARQELWRLLRRLVQTPPLRPQLRGQPFLNHSARPRFARLRARLFRPLRRPRHRERRGGHRPRALHARGALRGGSRGRRRRHRHQGATLRRVWRHHLRRRFDGCRREDPSPPQTPPWPTQTPHPPAPPLCSSLPA